MKPNDTPVRGKALLTAGIEKISLGAIYSPQGNDEVIQTV